GSCSTSRGRDTADNPRRAPRRRRRGCGPSSTSWKKSSRRLPIGIQQRGDRVIEVEQPLRRFVAGQRRDGGVAPSHPPGVRIVLGDQVAPGRDGHVVATLAVPGHLLNREAAFGLDEYGSAEQELEG